MLKLNKFEKFIWYHQRKFLFACWLVSILAIILLNLVGIDSLFSFATLLAVETIVLITAIYIILLSSRIKEFAKVYNYQLNMQVFLEGTNLLIENTSPKSKTQMLTNCYNRILTLFTMGDYDRVEYELSCFFHTFKQDNLTITIPAYIKAAQIALLKGNSQAYNEYTIKIQTLLESLTGLKIIKNALNYDFANFILYADAVLCNRDINEFEYESKVFEILNTDKHTGKVRKKEIMPIEYFYAYYKLFLFFKNKGNTQKAKLYAEMIMNIANDQLIGWREAKEYLENENRSN